jgi:hypothetical protein
MQSDQTQNQRKAEILDWLANPITKELMAFCRKERKQAVDDLLTIECSTSDQVIQHLGKAKAFCELVDLIENLHFTGMEIKQ